MLIDSKLTLSDGQSVTSSSASTNVLDLGKSGHIVGNSFFACCRVAESVTASGSASVKFVIETSDVEDFATKEEVYSKLLEKADLVEDSYVFLCDIGNIKLKRYVRGYYEVTTGPLTAGKFDLFMTHSVDLR